MKVEIQDIMRTRGRPFNIIDYIMSDKLDLEIPPNGLSYFGTALTHAHEILSELEKFEMSTERKDVENQLLQETVQYAKERIPPYAKKYEGINVKDIETAEDIHHLPFLTDDELKKDPYAWAVPEKIRGDNFCVSSDRQSGGTTRKEGEKFRPKHGLFSLQDDIKRYLILALGLKKLGLGRGKKCLSFLPAGSHVAGECNEWAARLLGAWMNWRHFASRTTKELLDTIEFFDPDFFVTVPIGHKGSIGTLENLLEEDKKIGILPEYLGEKTIILLGSPAPTDLLRNVYEIVSPEKICSGYGSSLFSVSGYTACTKSPISQRRLKGSFMSEFHIPPGGWIVYNFQEEDQPLPEISITTLGSEIMPLINYRIGDFAKIERCDCGLDLISDICRKEWIKMEPDGRVTVSIPTATGMCVGEI